MNTNEMKQTAWQLLEDNILPYWINKMKDPNGGFFGQHDGNDVLH